MPRNEAGEVVNPYTGKVVVRAMTPEERAAEQERARQLDQVRADHAEQRRRVEERNARLQPIPAKDSPLAEVLLANRRAKPSLTIRCPECQGWVMRVYPVAGDVYLLFRGIGSRERSTSGARNRNRMDHLAEPLRDRANPRYSTEAFCRCGSHWIEHRRIREALQSGTRLLLDRPIS